MRGMKQPIKVEPDIRLKDFDPGFCNGMEKEATRVETTKLCQRIGELEELLNANAKHSLIILLQGMDTSGKDGTVRRVLEFVDPAGVQAADEEKLCLGLRRVFAVAESYPALKADGQFLALQKQLAETEDRIAAARRFFNGNVRDLNRLREQFPTNCVAGLAGVKEPASYFELSDAAERVVPRVGV